MCSLINEIHFNGKPRCWVGGGEELDLSSRALEESGIGVSEPWIWDGMSSSHGVPRIIFGVLHVTESSRLTVIPTC